MSCIGQFIPQPRKYTKFFLKRGVLQNIDVYNRESLPDGTAGESVTEC